MNDSSHEIWLVLDSSSFGGIETHVVQLADGLKSHVEVRVVLLQDGKSNELKRMMTRKKIPFYICEKGVFSFVRLAFNVRPAIIHTHGYKAGICGRAVGKAIGAKVVSTFHAGEKLRGKLWCYDWCDRYSAVINDHVYSVSKKISEKLPVANECIKNFVDTEGLHRSSGSHIAFVGRLSYEKGPDTFCELARRFRASDFYIYGDGPMGEVLRKTAPRNVRFMGLVKNMEAEWKKVGVLVISSRYEGLPMVALEAMSRGIPVISHDVGDLSNLIKNGINGWLVKKECMSGLENALSEWMQGDIEFREKMSISAEESVKLGWSSNVVIPKYVKKYQDVCMGGARRMGKIMSFQKTVLFVHYGNDWIRGSEKCLIDLIANMDKCQYAPLVWTNSRAMARVLGEMNVTVVCQEFTLLFGWVKPRMNVSNFCRLVKTSIKMIREHNVDLIHVNSGAPMQWMGIASKITRTPLVNHLHSPYQFRDRLSLCLHSGSHTVCVSRYVKTCLVGDLPSRGGDISVIYNGINRSKAIDGASKINLRKMLSINDDALVVASVGSLIKRKGMDRCIRVLSKLTLDNPLFHLVIIGSGIEEKNLKALAEALGASANVHFLGNIERPFDLLKSQADVYLTLPREEAFGLTCIESAYAKLPVVAQNVGGIPEVIENQKSGILVSNVDEAVEAVHEIVRRKELGVLLVENNALNARKRFSMRRYCESFERLYGVLIRNGGSPRFSTKDFTEVVVRYLCRRIKVTFDVGRDRVSH